MSSADNYKYCYCTKCDKYFKIKLPTENERLALPVPAVIYQGKHCPDCKSQDSLITVSQSVYFNSK